MPRCGWHSPSPWARKGDDLCDFGSFSDSENASQFLLEKYVIFNSFSDPKELFKQDLLHLTWKQRKFSQCPLGKPLGKYHLLPLTSVAAWYRPSRREGDHHRNTTVGHLDVLSQQQAFQVLERCQVWMNSLLVAHIRLTRERTRERERERNRTHDASCRPSLCGNHPDLSTLVQSLPTR